MSFAIGLSGLNNALSRLDTAAATVARASIQDQAASSTSSTPLAEQSAASSPPPVDLVGAVVEQISASSAYMANLKTVATTDDTLKSLLK